MPIEFKEGVVTVTGEDIMKVASALRTQLRLRILYLVNSEGKIDMDQLAKKLSKSKANISNHVQKLEEARLVKVEYAPGKRGIRKYCLSNVREVRIILPKGANE